MPVITCNTVAPSQPNVSMSGEAPSYWYLMQRYGGMGVPASLQGYTARQLSGEKVINTGQEHNWRVCHLTFNSQGQPIIPASTDDLVEIDWQSESAWADYLDYFYKVGDSYHLQAKKDVLVVFSAWGID